MAFDLNNVTGEIVCRQGDSGDLVLYGIPTDKDYTLYWAARDNKNNIILEMSVKPIDGQATFKFSPSMTDKWEVPAGVKAKVYYWAVKLCCEEEDYEDTLVFGNNSTIATLNKLTVYPKVVEGTLI